MRKFASVPPRLWQFDLKSVRGDMDAIAVHYHLTTSSHANMLGLYHLPLMFLAYELGCPIEGASKGLQRLIEGGICTYDFERELVWVHNMAADQTAPELSPKDKRVKGIADQLAMLPICPITLGFYRKYRTVYHLAHELNLADFERSLARGLEGAPEALGSKNKNKNQKQDLETEKEEEGLGNKKNEDTYTRDRLAQPHPHGEASKPVGPHDERVEGAKEKKDPPVSNPVPQSHQGASSPAPKPNSYAAAQNGDDGSSGMFTAYEVPASSDTARRFLIGKGVPGSMLDKCVRQMMAGKFSPYDLEGVLDRGAA